MSGPPTSPEDLVARLFAEHVPDVASGVVEVRAVARIPGVKTKVAVSSPDPRVDPVVSCVGPEASHVKSIQRALGGERIDIIPWSETIERFIKFAFSPANLSGIELQPQTHRALVRVPSDQMAVAMGRDGVNRDLASRLVGWQIELVEAPAA